MEKIWRTMNSDAHLEALQRDLAQLRASSSPAKGRDGGRGREACVRGAWADALDYDAFSTACEGQIRGVCLARISHSLSQNWVDVAT